MTRSSKILAKKATVLLGPVFLFLFCLYLFLPTLRKSVTGWNLGMVSYDRDNMVVYAPTQKQSRAVWGAFNEFETVFRNEFKGKLDLSDTRRLRIHLFRTRANMSEYFETKYHSPLPHNAGFYDQSDQAIALSMTPNTTDLKRAIRHEAVHYFLQSGTNVTSPRWSPWLNEGIASVYEHYRPVKQPDGSKKWKIPLDTVRKTFVAPFKDVGLKTLDLKPLDKFMSISDDEFRSANNTRYYRQSSLLVYYLKERYPDTFWRYFQYEKQPGRANPEVLSRMLGKDLSTLQQEIERWLKDVRMPGPRQ